MKPKTKTNPNKVIPEILWYKMKTRVLNDKNVYVSTLFTKSWSQKVLDFAKIKLKRNNF